MKKVLLVLSISAGLMQACNDNSTKDSVEKADSTNDTRDTTAMMTKPDTTAGMGINDGVADFAVKAANGGMMEVKLGEYAAKNAIEKDVKEFGTMMATDHSKANNELKGIAASKNIALPAAVGDDNTKMMNDLMEKKGKDFDKAYMNMMVDDHKGDIKEFEDAADKSKDADMKAFAAKTLPTLKKHLSRAEAVVKSHNY